MPGMMKKRHTGTTASKEVVAYGMKEQGIKDRYKRFESR